MSDHDPLDLKGQERQKARRAKKAELDQETEEADLRWLMGSRRGRRVMWRFLDRAGVFRLSFDTNALRMAFAEGNRNEGLRILGLIHANCPELYPTMVRENGQRNLDDERSGNDN